MIDPPRVRPDQTVERGPFRVRSEQRWDLVLADGSRAVLGQLLPEIAADESLRRRYVYEAERLAALEVPGLARVLEIGPQPDPRDPAAEPPWRLREAPVGESLDRWLRARAPVPVDQAMALVAELADVIHGVHEHGAVLRDLEPRAVVLGEDGRVWVTDVGLARVDILSTRSASSLILESSPYAAPEHLRTTVVDPRADVYTLGVILWQALTGTLPFGDGPALLREHHPLPPLAELCSHPPPGLAELLDRCLAEGPEQRVASARDVAEALRGAKVPSVAGLERITCQACGEPLRPGLRLCLRCGREAVEFRHMDGGERGNYALLLTRAKEDEEFVSELHHQLEVLAEQAPDNLNFVIGDARMYSKEERSARIELPACLFRDLSHETAERLAERMRANGFSVSVRPTYRGATARKVGKGLIGGGAGAVAAGTVLGAAVSPGFFVLLGLGIVSIVAGAITRAVGKRSPRRALARLRAAPVALPASDAMVARLAGLLAEIHDPVVRERVAELALLVQRLCDHQTAMAGGADDPSAAELALVTEPLNRLVGLIEAEVRALIEVERDAQDLDEGNLVRAIAASEARGEPRSKRAGLLEGLDRLRRLEDQRARRMQRLLEAGSLLGKIVDLGLGVDNPRRLAENQTRLALAALAGTGAGDVESPGNE